MPEEKSVHIAVVGLGYVGLPVALAFAAAGEAVIGFDVNERRITELKQGRDVTGEAKPEQLEGVAIQFSSDPEDLRRANFYIVAVPTPVDHYRRPDLSMVRGATEIVGRALSRGDTVVFESTVYPGVTEDVCAPILERVSGLKAGRDFKLGYSPERISPGDAEHRFDNTIKIVSGQDPETLELVASTYEKVVQAGVYRAPSIKVAEAAKVMENTQRDINIALMNELAVIFNDIGIDTVEVIGAAATKWNFTAFRPGLVGGHCIGVDPYYLASRAEELGLHPELILAGRRLNDSMSRFIADNIIRELIASGRAPFGARVLVYGITYKEDVPDLRNSKTPDLIRSLERYGLRVVAFDPVAPPEEAKAEYGLELVSESELRDFQAVVVAVPHSGMQQTLELVFEHSPEVCVLGDIKSCIDASTVPQHCRIWRL